MHVNFQNLRGLFWGSLMLSGFWGEVLENHPETGKILTLVRSLIQNSGRAQRAVYRGKPPIHL
jgi:hypothetical protein